MPRPLNRTGHFGRKRQRANRAGMVVASLNMSASTSRMTDQIIIGKVVPRMKDAAEQMSKLLP
jgi:DNA-binding IclR family transcriptional regulator